MNFLLIYEYGVNYNDSPSVKNEWTLLIKAMNIIEEKGREVELYIIERSWPTARRVPHRIRQTLGLESLLLQGLLQRHDLSLVLLHRQLYGLAGLGAALVGAQPAQDRRLCCEINPHMCDLPSPAAPLSSWLILMRFPNRHSQSKSPKGVCEHCLLQKSAVLDGFHRFYDDFIDLQFMHPFRFEV